LKKIIEQKGIPQTFNLDNGETLRLMPYDSVTIEDKEVNEELKIGQKLGLIFIKDVEVKEPPVKEVVSEPKTENKVSKKNTGGKE
jgi:hypothetical protein